MDYHKLLSPPGSDENEMDIVESKREYIEKGKADLLGHWGSVRESPRSDEGGGVRKLADSAKSADTNMKLDAAEELDPVEEVKNAPPLDCNLEGLSIRSSKADDDEYMGAKIMLKKVKEKLDSAKKRHRSSLRLSQWERYQFHDSYDELQKGHVARIKEINRRHMEFVSKGLQPPQNQVVTGIDRVHWKDLTMEQFVEKYQKPEIPEDLFNLISEKRRPPYRWFLIGPKRSGTSAHIDPLGTSAWNALVYGRKRWIMTKPGTRKRQVKGYALRKKGEDGEASTYFSYHVPRILKDEAEKKVRDMGIREVIQEPGEVIYVPGGWYHAVLNLTHTIAVTQNFCARAQFLKIWRHVRKGRKKMALKWLKALKEKYPDLAEAALKCNEDDGWKMKEASKKKSKKKKKKKRKCSDSSDSEERRERRRRRNYDPNAEFHASRAVPSSSYQSGGGGRR
eukprot:jgi/Bigna1/131110/aug1.13_g5818